MGESNGGQVGDEQSKGVPAVRASTETCGETSRLKEVANKWEANENNRILAVQRLSGRSGRQVSTKVEANTAAEAG